MFVWPMERCPEEKCYDYIENRLIEIKGDTKYLEKNYEDQQKKKDQLAHDKKQLKEEKDELQNRLEKLNRKVRASEIYKKGYEAARRKLSDEIDSLEHQIENLEGRYAGYTEKKSMTLVSPGLASLSEKLDTLISQTCKSEACLEILEKLKQKDKKTSDSIDHFFEISPYIYLKSKKLYQLVATFPK